MCFPRHGYSVEDAVIPVLCNIPSCITLSHFSPGLKRMLPNDNTEPSIKAINVVSKTCFCTEHNMIK